MESSIKILIFFILLSGFSCIHDKNSIRQIDYISNEKNGKIEDIKQVNNKSNKENKYDSLIVFSEKAIVLSDIITNKDTLGIYAFGDTLLFEPGDISSCYYLPKNKIIDAEEWYRVNLSENLYGWIKSSDVAILLRSIEFEKYKVILKAICGDGQSHWIYGVVLDNEGKFIKKLYEISSVKGYFIDKKFYLFYQNYEGLWQYTPIDNENIKVSDRVYEFEIDTGRMHIFYINNQINYANNSEISNITLGIYDIKHRKENRLFHLIAENTDLGDTEAEDTYYGLSITKYIGIPCYTFRITRNDSMENRFRKLYIGFDGKLIKEEITN